jgi:DNA-binding XRE family transcriptional regulator
MKPPEYARRIKQLRAALQLTQHALAERLHVRPQVVASWEQGRREPSAGSYRRLADLAPPKEAWFYLNQIGVTKQMVRAKWPGRSSPAASKSPSAPPRPTTRIRIAGIGKLPFPQFPLLREGCPPTPREITPADIESVMTIPRGVLSDTPDVYVGIRHRGDSMAPILQDRFLVVVDRTNRDPATLAGNMVAAWGEAGLVLRWLARNPESGEVMLRPENPSHPTYSITAGSDGILGKVVFWWGTQG